MLLAIIYYLIFALNLFSCLQQKQSKWLIMVTLVLLGVMFYANDATYGDHISYMMDFLNGEREREGDILFTLIMVKIGEMGVSYQQYLLIIYIIEVVLIGFGIRSLTKNPHTIFAISMFFIFPYFSVGLRYSLAFSVFVFSFQFVKNKKFIPFFICLVISSLLHICMAAASILLLCFYKKATSDELFEKSKFPFWQILAVSLFLSGSMYLSGSFMFVGEVSKFLSTYMDDRGMIYLDNGIGNGNGMFLLLPMMTVCVILAVQILRYTNSRKGLSENSRLDYELAKVNYLITILSSVFFFFYCVTPSFIRLLVIPAFFNCLMLSRIYERRHQGINGYSAKISNMQVTFCLFVFTWYIPYMYNMFGCTSEYWIETTLKYFK